MEKYWDKYGNIHSEGEKEANIAQKAYSALLSKLANVNKQDAIINGIGIGVGLYGAPYLFNEAKMLKNIQPASQIAEKFFTNPTIEESPELYNGERSIQAILNYIGNNGIIKTPADKAILNEKNLGHFLFENNPERLKDIGKVKKTFETPDLIIKGLRDGKEYQYYAKPFKHNGEIRGHLNITRYKPNGNFYQTNFSLRKNKLTDLINNGQVIYNNLPVSTAPIFKNMSVTNIIKHLSKFFNP